MHQRLVASALSALALLLVVPGCARDDQGEPAAVPFVEVDPTSGSPTDELIADAQERLRSDPSHREARLALATAFLQKARETADPSLYAKADVLLADLRDDDDADPGVLLAEGVLALARHEFADALDLGRRALRLAPASPVALGIVVDAYNELGRYDEALEATQEMVDNRPDLASLSRVSYARELHGDLPGAIQAMSDAARAGAGGGEGTAYVQTQLGILLLTAGELESAAAAFDAAEVSFPGFVPALVGRARLLLAQGRFAEAARLLEDAAVVQPLVETVILQGDALTAAGDRQGARRAYELVDAIDTLQRENGVRTDLEMAIFTADHRPGPAGVADARRALEAQPGIFGHNALAWNLHAAGDSEAAWPVMRRALRTGSRDPQLRFHAAVIAEAVGKLDAARDHLGVVLATNPRFSARHHDTVLALARQLGLQADDSPTR